MLVDAGSDFAPPWLVDRRRCAFEMLQIFVQRAELSTVRKGQVGDAVAALVAALIVSEFFSLWATFDVEKITFPGLMWILVVPTLAALHAYSVLPDEVPEQGLDLREFYLAERNTWVVLLGAAVLLDIVRSFVIVSERPEWVMEYAGHVAMRLPVDLLALSLMWLGRSRRWDLFAVLLLTARTTYGIVSWTISSTS
jgi:hypothetical protein